jgi:V-type H+-transporting ATPase subunit a
VYAFGLDPVWHGTTTQLAYTNSLKMKIAVSLGVVQMTFGIILSAFNFKYFGETLSIWTEFLPQMIFMLSLFGYMITMVLLAFCAFCLFPFPELY